LARDGEGELIGWDLEDKDRKPFDKSKGGTRPEWGGDGTLVASLLLSTQAARLIPVRVDPGDPASLARALAFVALTACSCRGAADVGTTRADWEPLPPGGDTLQGRADHRAEREERGGVYPAALGLDNALAVEHGTASADAVGFGGGMQRLSGAPLAAAAAEKRRTDLLAREPGPRPGRPSSRGSANQAVARSGRRRDDAGTVFPCRLPPARSLVSCFLRNPASYSLEAGAPHSGVRLKICV